MPNYNYLAKDSSGNLIRATMSALDRPALLMTLRGRNLKLLKIESEQAVNQALSDRWRQLQPGNFLPPTAGQIELLMEQMAILLRSGMSLIATLHMVREQARFAPLQKILEDVSQRIQTGYSLGEALAQHRCFPELVVQLIRVGEQTGELDYVCQQAAHNLARQRANRSQLMTALGYPLFVAFAATGVAGFMVFYVIPKLRNFLNGIGRQLPPMTQGLLDFSQWLQAYGFFLAGMLVGLVGLIAWIYRTSSGRLFLDRMLLRVPIIGNIFRLAGTVSFANAMSVLTRSGVTILDSLQTVERLQHNRHLASCVGQVRRGVLAGGDMSNTLQSQRGFSNLLPGMVRVGEETGQLDEVLAHVAEFHDTQLEKQIRRLGALLEPAMIILVGALVGYVYMAFFAAIYSIGGSVR